MKKKIPFVDLKSVLFLYFYYYASFLLLLKDKSVIEKLFVYFVCVIPGVEPFSMFWGELQFLDTLLPWLNFRYDIDRKCLILINIDLVFTT